MMNTLSLVDVVYSFPPWPATVGQVKQEAGGGDRKGSVHEGRVCTILIARRDVGDVDVGETNVIYARRRYYAEPSSGTKSMCVGQAYRRNLSAGTMVVACGVCERGVAVADVTNVICSENPRCVFFCGATTDWS